jgi:hypothetical protein
LRLGDFLRAAAVMQSVYNGLLRLQHCFSGCRFRAEPTGIQPGQNLSTRNLRPFLNQYLGDAFAIVERKIHLAQIDIPIQD